MSNYGRLGIFYALLAALTIIYCVTQSVQCNISESYNDGYRRGLHEQLREGTPDA